VALFGVTGNVGANTDFASNAAVDDLVVYSWQAETLGSCYGAGAGNVNDPAAEPYAAAAGNSMRVRDGQGCDINLIGRPEQAIGTYHLHMRIRARVTDDNYVEIGTANQVPIQILYSRDNNFNPNRFYSTFVPWSTPLNINPDMTQASVLPYTAIDLSDAFSVDWRDYEYPENHQIDEWVHIWFPVTTPHANFYIDAIYLSSVQ